MPDRLEQFLRGEMKRVQDAWEPVGERAVEQTKDDISVPVERDEEGGVQRSLPGEHPRTDTGDLLAHVESLSDIEGDMDVLTVWSSREERPEVPTLLQTGTNKMEPRPYMIESFDRCKDDAYNVMVETLTQ